MEVVPVVLFCDELGVVPGVVETVPLLVVPGVIVEVGGQLLATLPGVPDVAVELVEAPVVEVPVLVLGTVVQFVELPVVGVVELDVVPTEVPPFWLALGVVPAVEPMLPVAVLGLVEGVATPPDGVCVMVPVVGVVVACPLTAGVLVLTPGALDCGVCPAPAGNVAVPGVTALPAVPVVPADPAVPVV